jgi:hypothetical protein
MSENTWSRRSIVASLGSAAAVFGLAARQAGAQTGGAFRPARHAKDAWLDAVPGKHRSFIDAATATGAGEGLLYANNLYVSNRTGYDLAAADVAVVICLRHFATVFAFGDAVWARYGKAIGNLIQFTDPKTKQPPSANVYNSADYGMALANFGNTIESVAKRGTQFAVCNMATTFLADEVAKAAGGSKEAVYKDFVANLIPNSHLVESGVLAVNRAQEYGYTLLSAL